MSIASQLSFSTATSVRGGALGSIPYQGATSATLFVSIGAAGTVLTSSGTVPIWAPASSTTVGTSTQVQTVLRPTAATHYLTFVDSNNITATAESLYTTSSFYINPGIGGVVSVGTYTNGTYSSNFTAVPNGTTSSQVTGYSFWGTFFNYPIDTGIRRVADITAGFGQTTGGTWGAEYLALSVGNNGAANDAAARTSEKIRINSTGSVLIGTTATLGSNPSTTLTILGQSTNRSTLEMGVATNTNGVMAQQYFYNGIYPIALFQATNDGATTGSGVVKWFTQVTGGALTERLRITSAGGIAFGGAANYGTAGQVLQSTGDSAPIWVNVSGTTVGTSTQVTTVMRTTAGAHYLTFVDSNNATATAESVYTTSTFVIRPDLGYVGINTPSPSGPLVISNAGAAGIEFFPSGSGVGSGPYFNSYNRSLGQYVSWANYALSHTWYVGTGGATRAVDIDSSGRVGIGFATPDQPLAFADSLATKIQFNGNNANGYQIGLASPLNSGDAMMKFTAGETGAGEFGFYNTTNLRLLINNNGAVLINRSTQVGTTRLHVAGGTNTVEYVARLHKGNYADTGGHTTLLGFGCEDSGWSKTAIGHTRTSSYDSGYFGIYVSNDVISGTDASTSTHRRVRVDGSGVEIANALGVGTPASGVTGEIRATNEITAYYSSDIRLKENIRLIADPITIVNQIRGVYYDWTDEHIAARGGEDGYFVRKHDIGVIAQEVEKVLPEIVATRDDGTKVVKYEKLVALLIEAVKDQQQQINQISQALQNLAIK